MIYKTYTIGGELYHAEKGTSGIKAKVHKYIDKIRTKTGKWRYIYERKHPKFDKVADRAGDVTTRLINEAGKLKRDQEGMAKKRSDNIFKQSFDFEKKEWSYDDPKVSADMERMTRNMKHRQEYIEHLAEELKPSVKKLLIRMLTHPVKTAKYATKYVKKIDKKLWTG